MFKHGSLFSGIGGFDLAADWMGWENEFHCEWNTFGQRVLNYYWPKAKSYNDITKTDFSIHRGSIDVLTGGFPCQPYSVAGKQKGTADERHLWPEMLRAIREIQPTYVVGENVPGLVNWSNGLVFEQVQSDLEAEGYEVTPFLLPACGTNAPHKRERIWFIAHATGSGQSRQWRGCEGLKSDADYQTIRTNILCETKRCGSQRFTSNTDSERLESTGNSGGLRNEIINKEFATDRGNSPYNWGNWPTQSPVCDGNDGISSKLDGITFPAWRNESIKAGGNAIVPQVALQIFKAIEQFESIKS